MEFWNEVRQTELIRPAQQLCLNNCQPIELLYYSHEMRDSLRVGLLILLAFTGRQACAQTPIPVVHTWGDLQNAPRITVTPSPRVEKGETPPMLAPVIFQVGIENNEAASYSGLLLYFIAPDSAEADGTPEERGLYGLEIDGGTPPLGRFEDRSNVIVYLMNHLSILLRPPLRRFQNGFNVTVPKKIPTSGTTFFAETIPFLSAGDYVVKLVKAAASRSGSDTTADRQVLAQATVHVQDRPQEIWFPFWTTKEWSTGAESGPVPDGSLNARYALVPVNNPKGGAAIPKVPCPQTYAQLPTPDQPLPSLFSNVTNPPNVQLKMVDATLIVTFDPKIEGFFPDDYFLTRWWVNGTRIDLDPTLARPFQARELAAMDWYTREVHFQLNFLPERLRDLKKGDQVSVQLLYCPGGFETMGRLDDPHFDSLHDKPDSPPSSFSEISNRVDFTYSGDPQHPQQ